MKTEKITKNLQKISKKVGEVIVGNDDPIEALLVALFSEGHVLLEGDVGIGKTTLAKTFAMSIGGSFDRIQMTPDLLPADVVGTEIYREGKTFETRKGPIFANLVLADELNRATPKVQTAFLEAMQEKQVTIGNETHTLKNPFMVVATQIPYGEAGTYPLTMVQKDRFALKVPITYPEKKEEIEILRRIDEIEDPQINSVMTPRKVMKIVKEAKQVYVDDRVKNYIIDLVTQNRKDDRVRTGPSPRASIWLYKGSRVRALLHGRNYVIPDDVKQLSHFVIPHRIKLRTQVESTDVQPDEILSKALEETPVPKDTSKTESFEDFESKLLSIEGMTKDAAESLQKSGYDDLTSIKEASQKELSKVLGIGRVLSKRIKEKY